LPISEPVSTPTEERHGEAEKGAGVGLGAAAVAAVGIRHGGAARRCQRRGRRRRSRAAQRSVYVTWVYSDPQTGEQERQQLMVDLFMAHTSGWHWSVFVAVLLGAFLASRARRTSHALAAAVPVGLLLAAVDLAVSWLTAGGTRQRLAWANESGWPSVPADLLADDAFRMVVAAGLATFASAAVAGVGLGTFFAPVLRSPTAEVARVTLLAVAVYGAVTMVLGWLVAVRHGESVGVYVVVGLLPPAAVTPTVVRAALGDHGGAFAVTLVAGSAAWSMFLLGAGAFLRRHAGRRYATSQTRLPPKDVRPTR
jgi:hypothetical protein